MSVLPVTPINSGGNGAHATSSSGQGGGERSEVCCSGFWKSLCYYITCSCCCPCACYAEDANAKNIEAFKVSLFANYGPIIARLAPLKLDIDFEEMKRNKTPFLARHMSAINKAADSLQVSIKRVPERAKSIRFYGAMRGVEPASPYSGLAPPTPHTIHVKDGGRLAPFDEKRVRRTLEGLPLSKALKEGEIEEIVRKVKSEVTNGKSPIEKSAIRALILAHLKAGGIEVEAPHDVSEGTVKHLMDNTRWEELTAEEILVLCDAKARIRSMSRGDKAGGLYPIKEALVDVGVAEECMTKELG